MKKLILFLFNLAILSSLIFAGLNGLDLSEYPVVSFYCPENDVQKVVEDGKQVEFWLSAPEEAFLSDLDIVLVLDTSGSMKNVVPELEKLFKPVIEAYSSRELRVRYSLVTFSDKIRDVREFTGSSELFLDWLSDIIPYGGGDDPESSFDAMIKATELDFDTKSRKIVLLVTNSPAHNSEDGSGYSLVDEDDVLSSLKDKGFIPFMVTPDLDEYRGLKEKLNGIYFNIDKARGLETGFAELDELYDRFTRISYRTSEIDFSQDHSIILSTSTGKYSMDYTAPEKINLYPIISSINPVPPVAFPGEKVEVQVSAIDPDGDRLAYNWKLNGKLIEGSSSKTVFTPASTGTFVVECEISDGKVGVAAQTGFKIIEEPFDSSKHSGDNSQYEEVKPISGIRLSDIERKINNEVTSFVKADLDGDGNDEIVVGTNEENFGEIFCFSSGMELLWNLKGADSTVYWPDDRMRVEKILSGDIDDDGEIEIVALLNNVPWFPSCIVEISNTGIVKGRYFHPGHIKFLELSDTNGDGIPEILFGGENAQLEYVTVFGVLDGRRLEGQAKPYYGKNAKEARELVYEEYREATGVKNAEFSEGTLTFIDTTGKLFVVKKE